MAQKPVTLEEPYVALLHIRIHLLHILTHNFPVLLAPVTQEHQVELVQAHLQLVTQVGLVKPIIAVLLAEHLAQVLAHQVLHLYQADSATPEHHLILTAQAVVQKLVTLV